MAIDVNAIDSIRPAFLRLSPSILDAARPQLEPVGYNQRYGFVGPANPLERTNETSPTYLRAFVGGPNQTDSLNEPPTVGTLDRDELASSRAALQPDAQQLTLFGSGAGDTRAGSVGLSQDSGFGSSGIAKYSAIQANDARLTARRGISVNV